MMFRTDSKLMQALTTAGDLLILSFFWILLSLTLVGFGPATTAGYYACVKSIRRHRGNLIREFFRALKQNWWKSMFAGLILLALGYCIYEFDTGYLFEPLVKGSISDSLMFIQAVIKLIFFLFVTVYLFPLLSRFETKLSRAVVTSFMMALRHFSKTLVMSLLLLACLMILITYPAVGWVAGSIYLYLLSLPMEKILLNYTPQEDGNEDRWYLES